MGLDCSPASALKELQLRKESLPFDWVDSNQADLQLCFEENFSKFHKKLTMIHGRLRVIDEYCFQFPHDYPKYDAPDQIIEEWQDYHHDVLNKYERRIKRLYSIFEQKNPIIVLFRGDQLKLELINNIIDTKFNKKNIAYVIASQENKCINNFFYCNPERNGIWNEACIWKESIQYAVQELNV